jgi:hypothetical protein
LKRASKKKYDIQVEEVVFAEGFAKTLEKGNSDIVITD